MKPFFLFTLLAILFSCKKDCIESRIIKYPSTITGYYYGFGQTTGFNSNIESFDFILTYDSNGKIIRRDGYNKTTEYSPNDIQAVVNYDSLSYKGDTIYIFNIWHNVTYNLFRINSEYIVIFNENGILKRDNKNGIFEEFYYDKNNRIDSSYFLMELNPGRPLYSNTKKYNYSNEGNLIEIEYVNTNYGKEPINIMSGSHFFSGYDNAVNPFKEQWMFEDTFLRSISNNNYTKHDDNEWIFSYDDCGYLQFY